MKAPYISPELVRFLDELYPDRAADGIFDPRHEHYRAGQVAVVRYLKRLLAEQRGASEEKPAAYIRLEG